MQEANARDMAELTITPDLESKSARISGNMSTGEHIAVRLVSCAALLSQTLRFRLIYAGVSVAIFPLAIVDAFAVDGGDLVFDLNLNTVRMRKALDAAGGGEIECDLVLDDPGSARRHYFSAKQTVGEWPIGRGGRMSEESDQSQAAKRLQDEIDAISNAMGGEEMPDAPNAREVADATKRLWQVLGGKVSPPEQ